MTHYCPAGGINCSRFFKDLGPLGISTCNINNQVIACFEQCPWPSYQHVVAKEKYSEEYKLGFLACRDMAKLAVGNLKLIKSWESDGEKITDIYLDADDKTRDAAIMAIGALKPNK
jgi:hypothetical protein